MGLFSYDNVFNNISKENGDLLASTGDVGLLENEPLTKPTIEFDTVNGPECMDPDTGDVVKEVMEAEASESIKQTELEVNDTVETIGDYLAVGGDLTNLIATNEEVLNKPEEVDPVVVVVATEDLKGVLRRLNISSSRSKVVSGVSKEMFDNYPVEVMREVTKELKIVKEGIGEAIKNAWNWVCEQVSKMWNWIKGLFGSKAEKIEENATNIEEAAKDESKQETVQEVATSEEVAKEVIEEAAKKAPVVKAIKTNGTAADVIKNISNSIAKTSEKTKGFFKQLGNSIKGIFNKSKSTKEPIKADDLKEVKDKYQALLKDVSLGGITGYELGTIDGKVEGVFFTGSGKVVDIDGNEVIKVSESKIESNVRSIGSLQDVVTELRKMVGFAKEFAERNIEMDFNTVKSDVEKLITIALDNELLDNDAKSELKTLLSYISKPVLANNVSALINAAEAMASTISNKLNK